MHGTVLRQIASDPYQRLFERACPGAVDRPHPARLYLLSFWVQNYWGRWSHARRCFADLRWNGKIRCKPDLTWETTAAIGLNEALCRKIDMLPRGAFLKSIRKTPALGLFLLWFLAGLGVELEAWKDLPPAPQHKNIKTYERGLAPFHHVHVTRPDEAEERRLIKRFKAEADLVARNMIIAGHLWLADAVARGSSMLKTSVPTISSSRRLSSCSGRWKISTRRGAPGFRRSRGFPSAET